MPSIALPPNLRDMNVITDSFPEEGGDIKEVVTVVVRIMLFSLVVSNVFVFAVLETSKEDFHSVISHVSVDNAINCVVFTLKRVAVFQTYPLFYLAALTILAFAKDRV